MSLVMITYLGLALLDFLKRRKIYLTEFESSQRKVFDK